MMGDSGFQEEIVELYLANIRMLDSKEAEQICMEKITEDRRSHLGRYRFEEDRKRSLLAGYLLDLGLGQRLSGDRKPEKLILERTEWGKPFLKEVPDVHFNLSHSGEWVFCGIASEEIGVDIQKEQRVTPGMAVRICTEEEQERMARDPESNSLITLWAIKEAYSKLSGRGLGQGFSRIQVLSSDGRVLELDETGAVINQAEFFLPKAPRGYCIAVCTRGKVSSFKLNRVMGIQER